VVTEYDLVSAEKIGKHRSAAYCGGNMFGLLKSGMKKMSLKLFHEDFAILRDHMSVDDQLKVYRKMTSKYDSIMRALSDDDEFTKSHISFIADTVSIDRQIASQEWADMRNPDLMAAALIEHLCNSVKANDIEFFNEVIKHISGWIYAMEMIDI
jgi:hypothetical protein